MQSQNLAVLKKKKTICTNEENVNNTIKKLADDYDICIYPHYSRFRICKITYLLKLICSLLFVINTQSAFMVIQAGMQPAKDEQGDALFSCFSCHAVSQCHFHGPFSATFFANLCLLFVISCLKWQLTCSLVFLSARRL